MITSSKTSSAPVASARVAQQLEEALGGRDEAHVRRVGLGEDRGELVLGGRGRAARRGSFHGDDDRRRRGRRRHAGARRDPLRRQARCPPRRAARRRGRGRRRRTSGASSRPVAARARRIALIVASVPDDVMRSISTAGIAPADLLGEVDLARPSARRSSCRAAPRRRHRGDDLRVRVAVDERPPRADPVDVAVAVDVDELGALARASTKIGSRPIERIARTGELTPPGRYLSARA